MLLRGYEVERNVMHYSDIIMDLKTIKEATNDSNIVSMIDDLIEKIRNGG